MSFGGPIDSMINTYKSNVRLLRGRKRLKEIQAEYPKRKKIETDELFRESQRADQLHQERFRKRIREFRREEGYRTLLIIVITIILLLIVFFWVISSDYSGIIETIS
ncbi:MAG: hypothetical protein AAGA85_04595 [Bacteroidota bacterium]